METKAEHSFSRISWVYFTMLAPEGMAGQKMVPHFDTRWQQVYNLHRTVTLSGISRQIKAILDFREKKILRFSK